MEVNVPQCGYCQPGFMMAAAKLIAEVDNPTDEDIKQNISNLQKAAAQVCAHYTST